MKNSIWYATALGLLLTGCSRKQEAAGAAKTNEAASGNPITAPVDYLGAVAKAKHLSEKTVDTASLNQAIQLFYAQEDRFPKQLDELVTKHYLGAIPSAPAGMKWMYNPQTGDLKMAKQ